MPDRRSPCPAAPRREVVRGLGSPPRSRIAVGRRGTSGTGPGVAVLPNVPGYREQHLEQVRTEYWQVHSDLKGVHLDPKGVETASSEVHSDSRTIHSDVNQPRSDLSAIRLDSAAARPECREVRPDLQHPRMDALEFLPDPFAFRLDHLSVHPDHRSGTGRVRAAATGESATASAARGWRSSSRHPAPTAPAAVPVPGSPARPADVDPAAACPDAGARRGRDVVAECPGRDGAVRLARTWRAPPVVERIPSALLSARARTATPIPSARTVPRPGGEQA